MAWGFRGCLSIAPGGLTPPVGLLPGVGWAVCGAGDRLGEQRPACLVYKATKKERSKLPFGDIPMISVWAIWDRENLNSSKFIGLLVSACLQFG